MVKAGYNSLKIVIYLLIGVILSGIISSMYLTKSINFEQFYDVGNVYEVTSAEYRAAEENWNYNYNTKLIEIQAGNARHSFEVKSRKKDWSYLCLELKNVSKTVPCEVDFFDKNGNLLYTIEHKLQNGDNILQLREGKIYSVAIVVREACSFGIQHFQFREKLQTFGLQEWLTVFGIVYSGCLFMILLILLVGLRRRRVRYASPKWEGWIEKVQEFYYSLLSRMVVLRQGISSEKVSQIRRILFLCSLVISHLILVCGGRTKILLQRRMVFALGICLLLIAVLSVEIRGRTVNWKNPLMCAWLALWSMSIVSEFVVGKTIQNVGVFMLGCMAPLYMAWGSMKRPERLLRDYLVAMQWSYWISACYCVFFRPYTQGIRYVGIYENTNTFAGYLVTVNIAFLIWLDENLNKKRLKTGTLCKNILALVSIIGFLILTESITSAFVYLMEWVFFLWKQFPNEKSETYRKNVRRVAVAFLLAVALVGSVGRWCLNNVPEMLNTTVVLEEDLYQAQEHSLSMVAHAAKLNSGLTDRIMHKIHSGDWDYLFSNRTDVWKTYIRKLNLFGHKEFEYCFGNKKWHAHNTLLQVMHYYGVFAAVPYLVMLYYSIKYGVIAVFSKKKSRMSLFLLLAVILYTVRGLTEDMVTPYLYVGWLTYYIALGGLVNQSEDRK